MSIRNIGITSTVANSNASNDNSITTEVDLTPSLLSPNSNPHPPTTTSSASPSAVSPVQRPISTKEDSLPLLFTLSRTRSNGMGTRAIMGLILLGMPLGWQLSSSSIQILAGRPSEEMFSLPLQQLWSTQEIHSAVGYSLPHWVLCSRWTLEHSPSLNLTQ